MSIEYLEIRNQNLEIAGIVDVFKSLIWHVEYYGAGDFEIYAPVSPVNLALLIEDNFVTRPNDENVGVIETVEYTFSATDGRMIVASGRFAKSILDRRLTVSVITVGDIPIPYEMTGNVELAVRNLIWYNIMGCTWDTTRNVSILDLGTRKMFPQEIVDENGNSTSIQTFLDNLLTWTDEFLKKYGLAANVTINSEQMLEYNVYQGKNRAVDNTDGNTPVIFSQDYENLISSSFKSDKKIYKNFAVIGGETSGSPRYYATTQTAESGLNRREIFIDGSNTSRTLSGSTITPQEYVKQLCAIAVQKLAGLANYQSFDGEINLNSLTFVYKTNYDIGDIVTIQDSDTKVFSNVRILEITEVQDDNGYTLTGKYESV